MKKFTVTLYQCEYCHNNFNTKEEAEEHEANHLNITAEVYRHYRLLEKECEKATASRCISNNESTRSKEDEVYDNLMSFVKEHHIVDNKI